jgi:hypothetical protein
MSKYILSLLLFALLHAACFLVGLGINERLRTSYPSATIVPVTLLFMLATTAVVSICFKELRLTRHSYAELSFWKSILGGVFVTGLIGLVLQFAWTDFSKGKVLLLVVHSSIVFPICYRLRQDLAHKETSWLVRSSLFRRSMALSLGLATCIACVVCSELLFGILLTLRKPGPAKDYRGDYLTPGAFFRQDEDLGIALENNRRVRCEVLYDNKQLWDVHYSSDEFGRRTTTHLSESEPKQFAVFFGCSYLFGEGSNDDETIPSQFSKAAPQFRSYNYGVPGYGTQQMLAIIESGKLKQEIREEQGIGVYLYLPEIHESRVIGEMEIVNSFGANFPYYFLDKEKNLQRNGQFSSGRKLTNSIYSVLGKSRTRQYFGLNFPRRQEAHYQLATALMVHSAKLFKEQFPTSEFYVVVYPNQLTPPLPILNNLKTLDIKVMDFSKLFDSSHVENQYVGDGHPTPKANAMLATALSQSLTPLQSNNQQ